LDVPKDMQVESFLDLLDGTIKVGRDQIYYHYYENGEHAVSPHFGVSDGRYKLIRFYKRVEGWELFDLETDPNEMNNIYGQPASKKIQKRMEKLLRKEINKLDDQDAKKILATKVAGR